MAQSPKKRTVGKPKKNRTNQVKRIKLVRKNMETIKNLEEI
jgi:hypothetical protein